MDGRTDGRTHARKDSGMDGRLENIWPPPAPTAGGGLKMSPTSRHVKILGCGKFFSVSGEFVIQQAVELL